MPTRYIPSVRARRLARSLKEARDQAGLGVTAAAGRLGWSQGKVSHIESCRNKVSATDVALMLDTYGVTTPEKDALLVLAREANQRNWWTDYVNVFNGPYVALEDAAEEIGDWSPMVIPGLLQTQDYARAIMTGGRPKQRADKDGQPIPHVDKDLERRLKARVARQTILSRKEDQPHLHVVLDEGVLHRRIGSPQVMRDQLRKLHAESQRPNVTIQVLPLDIGAHVGLEGPCIVLRFAEPDDPDVAYAEGFHGAVYMEAPQKVGDCRLALEWLRENALDPEDSAALINAAVEK